MIEWGILGTGSIAKIFARAIKTSKKSRLFGVASRSARNAKEFCSVFDCSGFAGYHELINHNKVDAIYIATPHPFHFDL
ncbi:MAG: Gfo/Idh/MocA family oxidoreductase, partial [Pseudomonadota bacterium]|nr:Gfo/Idh/MocA family oxidoreductase [Pseudomonadota bacterium]